MPNRDDANHILGALLAEIDARVGQVFQAQLTPIARWFRDWTLIRLRRVLLAELGIRDETIAAAVYAAGQGSVQKEFTDVFDLPTESVALDRDSLGDLLVRSGGIERRWPNLYEQYPMARGVLSVSEPIYNSHSDMAIMYLGQALGPLVGQGRVWSFYRDDCWRIDASKQISLWVA